MDTKLFFKPIELLDIGIDKKTKIPIPILSDNILSTFDIEDGLPSDSFTLKFDANYSNKIFSCDIISDYEINLSFDYGDGINETFLIKTGGTYIEHTYTSAITYDITVTGWIERIKNISFHYTGSYGGIIDANIIQLKNLSSLDLSNNRIISLNLTNMINLNQINLDNNYLTNDAIDDLYITADTFLTFNGNLSTLGSNNGKPSIYSLYSRNNLTTYKFWTLNYNI